MADYFQVELDTLNQYLTSLQEAQRELADLPRLLSGVDYRLGNDKLDAAAEDFQESWRYGAKQLGESVAETTEAVRTVRQAYLGADGDVAGAMSTLRQPLGTVDEVAGRLDHTAPGHG